MVQDDRSTSGKNRTLLLLAVLLATALVLMSAAHLRARADIRALDQQVRQLTRHPALTNGIVNPPDPPDAGSSVIEEPYGNRSLLLAGRGESLTIEGQNTTLTSGLGQFRETVRIANGDTGTRVDALEVECNGGTAVIGWQIGTLEGVTAYSGLTLTILFDGDPEAAVVQGADGHIFQDEPVSFSTVRECPAGRHVIELELSRVDGAWGFPYVVNPGDDAAAVPVLRGFIVREIW